MEKIINKRFCLVYDTFRDMIQDPDISVGMIVMTMGYESLYDEGFTVYKISMKNNVNMKKTEGRPFGIKSPYYAVKISDNSCHDIYNRIDENTAAIKSLGSTIDSSMYRDNKTTITISSNTPNEIVNELYLDDDKHVKVVMLSNGKRYIVSDGENGHTYNISITLSTENSWIIPSEFIVSDYKIDTLCISTNNHIDYIHDNTLLFTLQLDTHTSNVIPY